MLRMASEAMALFLSGCVIPTSDRADSGIVVGIGGTLYAIKRQTFKLDNAGAIDEWAEYSVTVNGSVVNCGVRVGGGRPALSDDQVRSACARAIAAAQSRRERGGDGRADGGGGGGGYSPPS